MRLNELYGCIGILGPFTPMWRYFDRHQKRIDSLTPGVQEASRSLPCPACKSSIERVGNWTCLHLVVRGVQSSFSMNFENVEVRSMTVLIDLMSKSYLKGSRSKELYNERGKMTQCTVPSCLPCSNLKSNPRHHPRHPALVTFFYFIYLGVRLLDIKSTIRCKGTPG